MRFDIITIFPKIFDSYFEESIIKRAQENKIIKIKVYDLRAFSKNKHKKVDDKPYGGGAGMIQMAEPIINAVDYVMLKSKKPDLKRKIIVFSAKGRQFNQKLAQRWSKLDQLIMISGRYEGIDERVRIALKAEEVSVGPYVLTDGDVAIMAVVSAVTRLIPGAIKEESLKEESFRDYSLSTVEYPQYTRPEIIFYKGKKYRVPKVLLSGHHKNIENWRKKHQIKIK